MTATLRLLVAAAVGATTLAGPPAADPADFVIVPGARVGAITVHSTLGDLARAYGENNVRLVRVNGTDGTNGALSTVIFPDDSSRRLVIAWSDTVNLRYPRSVSLRGKESMWHTADGLTLGTTMVELQKINRKPYDFYGFGWDNGGQVTDWHGGSMAHDSLLGVRLDALHLIEVRPYQSVMGEKTVSSSNHLARELRPYVGWLDVRLTGM